MREPSEPLLSDVVGFYIFLIVMTNAPSSERVVSRDISAHCMWENAPTKWGGSPLTVPRWTRGVALPVHLGQDQREVGSQSAAVWQLEIGSLSGC